MIRLKLINMAHVLRVQTANAWDAFSDFLWRVNYQIRWTFDWRSGR